MKTAGAIKLSAKEAELVHWSLTVAVEWEIEALRCQQDRFSGKALRGYGEFNREARRRIKRCRALVKRIERSRK